MVSKGAKRDESPQKSGKKEPTRTYRKSPARSVKKSPSRVVTTSPPLSPKPRRALRNSPSRVTSTETSKSPSRKSPSRKSTTRISPARTRPSRLEKSESNVPERTTRTSTKTQRVVEVESESDDDLPTRIMSEKPEALVRGRPRKSSSEAASPQVFLQNIIPKYKEPTPVKTEVSSYISLIRRPATKSQTHEIDHIINYKRESSTSSIKKLTELSDEDDILKQDVREKSVRKSEPRSLDKIMPNELGLWHSALVAVFILITPVVYSVFCNEKHCDYTKLPNLTKYKFIDTYLDVKMFVVVIGWGSLVAILGALPFGGPKISGLPNKQSRLNYTMNGFFTLVIIGMVLIALEATGRHVIDNILKKYFQFCISLTATSVFLAILMYIRSFYVPLCSLKSDALISSGFYNFFHGREVNPRIWQVIDIKLCLLRFFCIFGVLMNAILIYQSVSFNRLTDGDIDYKSIKYNLSLLLVSMMLIIYYSDLLIFETWYVTTFTGQYQAVGYEFIFTMIVSPFLGIASSKYVFDYNVVRPPWVLLTAVLFFTTGYFLYRLSNSQKHKFRLNPYNPAVSHLETIPTSQGRKLLVSGYWGMVRHPNYLGDIMMQIAFALFVFDAIPIIVYILDILLLVDRSRSDGLKCKQRYGSAWERYCQRVKYSLIPKVF